MSRSRIALDQDEEEVLSGFANKIGFWGGPGGRLILTTKRLIFANRRRTSIRAGYRLKDILHVGSARSMTIWTAVLLITALLRNAVRITLKGGRTQRFVVNNKQRWIDLIDRYSEIARAKQGNQARA